MLSKVIMSLFIILFSFGAYFLSALSLSGAAAASVVGILIGLGFGMKGLAVLFLFFITSSLFSKFKKAVKAKISEKNAKGDRRDWQQVLANGGVASFAAFGFSITGEDWWLLVFSIALASANADTWASELGVLSRRAPFSLRTFSSVPAGISGAVSILGTVAALAGSFLIAASVYLLFPISIWTAGLIFTFGFLGNLIDSFLGAFVQVIYKCPRCGIETEKGVHCGNKTVHLRGYSFINNDFVNFLSGSFAVLCGLIIYLW